MVDMFNICWQLYMKWFGSRHVFMFLCLNQKLAAGLNAEHDLVQPADEATVTGMWKHKMTTHLAVVEKSWEGHHFEAFKLWTTWMSTIGSPSTPVWTNRDFQPKFNSFRGFCRFGILCLQPYLPVKVQLRKIPSSPIRCLIQRVPCCCGSTNLDKKMWNSSVPMGPNWKWIWWFIRKKWIKWNQTHGSLGGKQYKVSLDSTWRRTPSRLTCWGIPQGPSRTAGDHRSVFHRDAIGG